MRVPRRDGALFRYVSYTLSIAVAFSVGTLLVMLRDGSGSAPKVAEMVGSAEASALVDAVAPLASLAPLQADPQRLGLSAALPIATTPDRAKQSTDPLDGTSAPGPDPELLARAPVDEADGQNAQGEPDEDLLGPESQGANASAAGVQSTQSGAISTGSTPQLEALQSEPRSTRRKTHVIATPTPEVGSQMPPPRPTISARPVMSRDQSEREGRGNRDRVLTTHVPDAPALGARGVRRVKQNPPVAFVALPPNALRGEQSGKEAAGQVSKERLTRIQLPQALHPTLQ